ANETRGRRMREVPRVKAVRIEESWQVPGLRVRCVAHLTRPLSNAEARIMEASSRFHAAGGTVTYVCRPEESDDYAQRLESGRGRPVRHSLPPLRLPLTEAPPSPPTKPRWSPGGGRLPEEALSEGTPPRTSGRHSANVPSRQSEGRFSCRGRPESADEGGDRR